MQRQAATEDRHRLEEQLAEARGRISELRGHLGRAHAAAADERQRAQQEVSTVHSDLNAIAEERYQLQARTRGQMRPRLQCLCCTATCVHVADRGAGYLEKKNIST